MTRVQTWTTAAAALCGALAVGVIAARDPLAATPGPAAKAAKDATANADKDRDADREAIRKSGQEFARAFAKGDAGAIAALWTDQGECHEPSGTVIVGRGEIEKAFAAHFKDRSLGTIEIDIHSVRFPSQDTAIEEGFLRYTPSGPGLPSSTMYTASHVREGGRWLMAYSREFGAGQDRLGDLAFLIGKWEGGPKGHEVTLSFERDGQSQFILGRFTRKADGKVVAGGQIKIGLDGKRGQLRSWHFDDDGGHGQCLWLRDGNRWVLDAVGALADGKETAAVNVLARLGADEITWRSIDRVVGGEALPDTVPVKLTRARDRK